MNTVPTNIDIGAEKTAYQIRLSISRTRASSAIDDNGEVTSYEIRRCADELAEAVVGARITSAAVSAYGCPFVAAELIERDTGAVVPFDVLPVQEPQICRVCKGSGETMFYVWHTGKEVPVMCGKCHGTGYFAVGPDADGQIYTIGDLVTYNETGERYMALDVVPCRFGYGGGNVWVRKVHRGQDGAEYLEDGYFAFKCLPATWFRLSKGGKLAGLAEDIRAAC